MDISEPHISEQKQNPEAGLNGRVLNLSAGFQRLRAVLMKVGSQVARVSGRNIRRGQRNALGRHWDAEDSEDPLPSSCDGSIVSERVALLMIWYRCRIMHVPGRIIFWISLSWVNADCAPSVFFSYFMCLSSFMRNADSNSACHPSTIVQ